MNDSAENRCVRCGRRLHGQASRPSPERAAGSFGTALALQRVPEQDAIAMPQPEATAPQAETASDETQPSLFRDAGPSPKVVPIPTLSPLRPASPLDRDSVRRNAARSAARTGRQGSDAQQSLDLHDQEKLRPRADEALYCDARVALPTHRAMAAVVDFGFVLLGSLVFVGLAYATDVDFQAFRSIAILPLLFVGVVMVLYRGLWCLANSDTPGMKFAGLRLVDFDGRRPRRDRRIVRQFAGILSLASAGVGLVWALVDEESLTWHDHISKTFPTTV